jgi:dihydropteroate synthase
VIFRARQFELRFPRPALVMGIVNVTPDSFSDGGQFFDTRKAIAHGEDLVRQGAGIIDVGGESTRPGAAPVAEEEELRRVIPVIEKLAQAIKVPISIDTMKPGVARKAIEAGASIVNDVAANRAGVAMWEVVAETEAGYVCMHMQGTPQTMQVNPSYTDVVAEVKDFFMERLDALSRNGVVGERVILDPGIGFGKSLAHNLQLIGSLREFTKLGAPVLVGVSRKSFLGRVGGEAGNSRLPAALACASLAIEAGVSIIRAHDVAETVQAVRMTEAIAASSKSCPGHGTQ